MKTLDEIGCQYITDRSSKGWHNYFVHYQEFMEPLRHKPIRLLEIGVLGGGGIKTWSEYFDHPQTVIVGADIELWRCEPIKDPRVILKQGSQDNCEFLKSLPGPFDIVIDDGSHMASHQFATFFCLWPLLKPGGYHCIEDLHVAWSPVHCNANKTIIQFLQQIIEEMQARGALAQAKRDPGSPWSDVDTVTVRRGLAILRKHKQ